ncbi:transcriptional regulator, DeoR family [Peptoniphilus sp. oral taxon 375 str. F0436]|nr:transcriptional regulator, DeoR family [Peptoniphilus sp. oral taxon 375 str. F0436]
MKKLEQIRQESKEIKDKIDDTEERLRQLKNQEQKILKQDIVKRRKFKSTESSFTTILKNLNYDTQNVTQNVTQSEGQNEGKNEGQNDGKKLKPKDRRNKIVKLMKENSNITTIELSHILLVSVSTIERDLKVLTDEKTIDYIGSAKDGYWKVNK